MKIENGKRFGDSDINRENRSEQEIKEGNSNIPFPFLYLLLRKKHLMRRKAITVERERKCEIRKARNCQIGKF